MKWMTQDMAALESMAENSYGLPGMLLRKAVARMRELDRRQTVRKLYQTPKPIEERARRLIVDMEREHGISLIHGYKLGGRKEKQVKLMRALAVELRRRFSLSLPMIAKLLGYKSHSAVLWNLQKSGYTEDGMKGDDQ